MSVLQNQASTEPVTPLTLRNTTKKLVVFLRHKTTRGTAAHRQHLTNLVRMSITLSP